MFTIYRFYLLICKFAQRNTKLLLTKYFYDFKILQKWNKYFVCLFFFNLLLIIKSPKTTFGDFLFELVCFVLHCIIISFSNTLGIDDCSQGSTHGAVQGVPRCWIAGVLSIFFLGDVRLFGRVPIHTFPVVVHNISPKPLVIIFFIAL